MRHSLLAILCIFGLTGPLYSAEPVVGFDRRADRLVIRIGETDVATYVFRDEQVPRPYFAHVKTLAGVQVTRQHPPQKGADAVDHEGLHTGIWLSFGDLNGQWVGLTVLTGRQNFRPCWSHARDYGFLALNPFGRQAFTKQEPSRVVVQLGKSLRLRYGVVVHATPREADYDPVAANVAFNPPPLHSRHTPRSACFRNV